MDVDWGMTTGHNNIHGGSFCDSGVGTGLAGTVKKGFLPISRVFRVRCVALPFLLHGGIWSSVG